MSRLSLPAIAAFAALVAAGGFGCGRTALLPPRSCEALTCPSGLVCEEETGRCVDPFGRPDGGGTDAGPDAGQLDGGWDASVPDAGPDGGFDAGFDGGFDGGVDSGVPDAGGPDGGHGPCANGCPPTMFCDTNANGGQGACVTCTQTQGCGGATPYCDTNVQGGHCVQCLNKSHCPSTQVCQAVTRTCGPCLAHDQCGDGMFCSPGSVCQQLPDTCATAQTLNFGGGNQVSFTALPHLAKNDAQEVCNLNGGPEVVYRFTLTQTRNVTISASPISGGTADVVLYLRAGNCQNGMSLSCQNGAGTGGTETASLSNLGPGDYYLFVENVGAAVGPVSVTVTLAPPVMAPANDTCAGRQVLNFSGNSAFTIGSTANATNGNLPGALTPGCSQSARQTGADVVYEFTLPQTADVTLTVTPLTSGFRPAMYLRGPAAFHTCDKDMQVTCAAAPETGPVGPLTRQISGLVAGTYYLWVDGVAGTTGTFSVQVTRSAQATNDTCATAQQLVFTGSSTHQVATASGDTSFANNDNQSWNVSPTCSTTARQSGKDVVFRYTLPGPRDVTVKVTPTGAASTFQPVVYVRSPGNCASTSASTELGCAAASSPTSTTVSLPAQQQGTYFVWVDGALGTSGSFDIEVTATAQVSVGGDNCPGQSLVFNASGAAQVSSSLASATNSNSAGDAIPTCSPGAKNVGRDLIYSYTLNAPRDVTLTLTPTSSSWIPALYVKAGACNSNAIADERACVTRFNSGPVTYKLLNQAPGTYWIFVDSASPAVGTFVLDVQQSAPTPPPPNDTCSGAQQLQFINGVANGAGDTTNASNSNNSSDAAPTCSPTAKQKGRDVVFQYTLTSPQDVSVLVTPTSNSTFQPVVYVRGPGVGHCGSISAGSEMFCMQAPQPGPLGLTALNQSAGTYSLYVDGANDTFGAFNVAVSLGNATVMPETCPSAQMLTLGQPLAASNVLAVDDYSRQSFPPYGTNCLAGNNYTFTGRDLVYAFTATQATHTATLTPSNGFDAALLFLRAPSTGSCSPSWCDVMSDNIGAGAPETIVMQGLVPGQTYYLVVDAWTSGSTISTGTFTLLVQ